MNGFTVHADTLANYLDWLNATSTPAEAELEISKVGSFTWQNSDYACNFRLSQKRDLQAGGFIPMDDLVIEVLQEMTEPGPQSEQKVIFKGKSYLIREVRTAAGKYPQLICYDPARGA